MLRLQLSTPMNTSSASADTTTSIPKDALIQLMKSSRKKSPGSARVRTAREETASTARPLRKNRVTGKQTSASFRQSSREGLSVRSGRRIPTDGRWSRSFLLPLQRHRQYFAAFDPKPNLAHIGEIPERISVEHDEVCFVTFFEGSDFPPRE